jgi:peroxiredoxin
LFFVALQVGATQAADGVKPPAVGEAAPDFELTALDGEKVKLSALTRQGPVVLAVLRGYPGYQCPACNAQVGDFLARAKAFAAAKASVVIVYPGESQGLTEHAQEFVRGKSLPDNFYLATDPDYSLTNKYGLRWDAKGETAYPSTLLIGTDGKVRYSKISKTHGDRAKATSVLEALK